MFETEQENLWSGSFGTAYLARNRGQQLVDSNVIMFREILSYTTNVTSVAELGCNIGLNLRALNYIDPILRLSGYEINEQAANEASSLNIATIHRETILNALDCEVKFDLAFTKGVLIHIHPDQLSRAYDNLLRLSSRYILICEYYSPAPVSVPYRGQSAALFKRDFAGELIEEYGLKLKAYRFLYHLDTVAPQDDMVWFLLEKP